MAITLAAVCESRCMTRQTLGFSSRWRSPCPLRGHVPGLSEALRMAGLGGLLGAGLVPQLRGSELGMGTLLGSGLRRYRPPGLAIARCRGDRLRGAPPQSAG